jgi:hypothetical protein
MGNRKPFRQNNLLEAVFSRQHFPYSTGVLWLRPFPECHPEADVVKKANAADIGRDCSMISSLVLIKLRVPDLNFQ